MSEKWVWVLAVDDTERHCEHFCGNTEVHFDVLCDIKSESGIALSQSMGQWYQCGDDVRQFLEKHGVNNEHTAAEGARQKQKFLESEKIRKLASNQ